VRSAGILKRHEGLSEGWEGIAGQDFRKNSARKVDAWRSRFLDWEPTNSVRVVAHEFYTKESARSEPLGHGRETATAMCVEDGIGQSGPAGGEAAARCACNRGRPSCPS